MKSLVTGGAGFIGSHLAEALLLAGHEVRILDDLSSGREANLVSVRDAVDLQVGNVADLEVTKRAVEGRDLVFHLAAIPSVTRSVDDPFGCHRANTLGTLNVLEASRRARVARVVYASSSSVYGDSPTLPKHESMREDPLSPYAAQKLLGEHYCGIYARLHGLSTVALRFFNVFGPRQDPASPYSGVISIFARRLLEGEPPEVHGTGEQSRDFVYVGNVVDALTRAALRDLPAGMTINVASGRRITVNELVTRLRKLTGGPAPIHGAPRPGDVSHSLADISRARELLGYTAAVDLDQGLERTLAWLRKAVPQQRKESGRHG
ncbi:MAG: SDR family oxidoreductase [Planctomycetota bacterium]